MTWLLLVLDLAATPALAAPLPASELSLKPAVLPVSAVTALPAADAADASKAETAGLTLVPPDYLGSPPKLVLGRAAAEADLSKPAELRETPIDKIPTPGFFGQLVNVFEAQDVEWPLGTTSSVHIQAKTDGGLGRLVPYVSILQDVDEFDAHERFGAGAGLTYRILQNMRVDVEFQYLGGYTEVNPALGDERRAMVLFTIGF